MITSSRIALLSATAATLLLTACGTEKSGSLTTGTAASGGAAVSTAEPSGTTEPAPAPNADGKFAHTCDMLLNSDFESSVSGWLVADAELKNSGDVGIKVNVKAVWKPAVSTDQIDAYQSAPGYFNNSACGVNATITSNFGRVHG